MKCPASISVVWAPMMPHMADKPDTVRCDQKQPHERHSGFGRMMSTTLISWTDADSGSTLEVLGETNHRPGVGWDYAFRKVS